MEIPKNSNGMNPENTPPEAPVPSQTSASSIKSQRKNIFKEIVIFVVVAFGIVLPFRIYIAEPYLVDGRSMDPTFATGDYLIVDKFSYRKHAPERNSVLVLKYPGNPKKSFIKRIIGLPGETVVVKDNTVKIVNAENPDGFMLDQSYIAYPSLGSFQITLAGDEYFVMGDNRKESFDSRSWGPLNKKYILGKPILRLFPISKLGIQPGELKK